MKNEIMDRLLKKFLIVIFVILLTSVSAVAKDRLKMTVKINHEFTTEEVYDEIRFKSLKRTNVTDDIVIPQRSIIVTEFLESQNERRWHKSGFIVCKLKYFITDYYKEVVNLDDKDIYLIVKKYEKIDGKDVAITGSEVVLSSAASFFVPGVDILYFFTKGAIKREKYNNWFKAGVSNAYENSIFWFWLKGKPIELEEEDTVSLIQIGEKRAYKLKSQIEKRKEIQAKRLEKKNNKKLSKDS